MGMMPSVVPVWWWLEISIVLVDWICIYLRNIGGRFIEIVRFLVMYWLLGATVLENVPVIDLVVLNAVRVIVIGAVPGFDSATRDEVVEVAAVVVFGVRRFRVVLVLVWNNGSWLMWISSGENLLVTAPSSIVVGLVDERSISWVCVVIFCGVVTTRKPC